MSQIEWVDAIKINIREIDIQHQRWIDIHNSLDEVLTKGSYQEVEKTAIETLKAMHDYSHVHFKFEEAFMQKIQYPDLIEHRRMHKDFSTLIYQHYRDILEAKIVLNSVIMKMIKNWLIDHIMMEDKKIASYLRKTAGVQT